MNDFIDKYAALGWSLMPLGAITKDRAGKKKIVFPPKWKNLQNVRPTAEKIKTAHPKNLGAVAGALSGFFVVDEDAYKEGFDADFFKSLHIPPTPVQKTASGGRHYFLKYPESGSIRNSVSIGPNSCVDIRGEGGMVVIPPSKTNYGEYCWLINPFDAPLADAPKELLALIVSKKKRALSSLVNVRERIDGRNNALTVLAGTLLFAKRENEWGDVLLSLRAVNRTYTPPLDDVEVVSVFNSIAGIERVRRAEGAHEDTNEEELRQAFKKERTKATYNLALHISKKYSVITVGEKEREYFAYKNGYYSPAGNEIILPEIQRILGNQVTKNAKSETLHKIADATAHPRRIFYEAPLRYIPLQNGVYDREENILLPHDPAYRFRFQFPFMYSPNADCPKIRAFFEEVLKEEDIPLIEEWLGYYFYRAYDFKKAIIFAGEGDTGKTTLLEVIISLLGEENIASIPLQKMTADKFSAAHLYQKHGNIVDELSAKDVLDTGKFKIATGGGTIAGEYKFGNQFSFKNFAKFTFACNRIPDVTDVGDEAYFARWMVVRFEKQIKNKIPNFVSRLTTKEELSGLFNRAMNGLARLIKNGQFSYANTAVETKTMMMRGGSSIAQFVADRVKEEPGAEVSKEDFYESYMAFVKEKGLAAETKDMLGKKLSFYAPFAIDCHITDAQKQKRGWRNVIIARADDTDDMNEADF